MVFAQPGTFFEQNMVARAYLCTNKSLCMCTLYILQQRTVGRKKLWHLQQGRYKSPGNFPGILRRTKSQSDRNPASCSIIDCIRCANCTMFFMKPRPITEVELSGFLSMNTYVFTATCILSSTEMHVVSLVALCIQHHTANLSVNEQQSRGKMLMM